MSTNWPDDKPRGLLSLLELVGPVKPPGDPFRDVKNIQLRHGGSQRQEHSSLTPCASAAGACGGPPRPRTQSPRGAPPRPSKHPGRGPAALRPPSAASAG